MSFFGLHILSDAEYAKVKPWLAAAGHDAKALATNELDKAVAAAKGTELGTAVTAAIHAAEDTKLSGAEKLAHAVAAVAPVVVDYATRGGFHAVLADAEGFARQLVESTLADIKATKAVGIAKAILSLIGL